MSIRDDAQNIVGQTVNDANGNSKGTVDEVFYDDAGQPTWATVNNGGSKDYIPLHNNSAQNRQASQSTTEDHTLEENYGATNNAPFDDDYDYATNNYKASIMDENEDIATPNANASVDLHEEQLDIQKTSKPKTAHINKRVTSHEEQTDVPVMEEHARLVVDQNTTPHNGGATAFQDESINIPLEKEEVVVNKHVVHTGTAHLDIDQEEHRVPVRAQVRKEEADLVEEE